MISVGILVRQKSLSSCPSPSQSLKSPMWWLSLGLLFRLSRVDSCGEFFATKEVSFEGTPSAIKLRMPKSSPGTSFQKLLKSRHMVPCLHLKWQGIVFIFLQPSPLRCNLACPKVTIEGRSNCFLCFSAVRALGSESGPHVFFEGRIRRTDSFKRSSRDVTGFHGIYHCIDNSINLGQIGLCCEGSLASRLNSTPALIAAIFTELPPHRSFSEH